MTLQNEPIQNSPVQDAPIQDGATDASREEKLTGLITQVSADARDLPAEDARRQFLDRLRDSRISVTDAELEVLLARIAERH